MELNFYLPFSFGGAPSGRAVPGVPFLPPSPDTDRGGKEPPIGAPPSSLAQSLYKF